MKKESGFLSQKNTQVSPKKKMIYFILESKETGDIWTDSRDFNDMQSRYYENGWTYEDVKGSKGRIILESISKSEFESVLKMLKPVPLGFKIEEGLKQSLEKIAAVRNIGLIDVTTEAIKEYVLKNEELIK
ncbi:hypothetical protein [Natronincola ferrireducens]|uniref:Uncharacterized protein n=1 Tax=Natronincola ferrireducens TaxID=393762 RepID=A0A1G9FT44_9FIRM|nr:hypothetical protein [Natronincola ferrireducens]SDK91596.1 hypothetical protein SAMN05660472_02241 [Natronincola ferrireducens]